MPPGPCKARNNPQHHTTMQGTNAYLGLKRIADWLDDEAPIQWIAELLELITRTPNLDWLLLTKRPGNWTRRITDALAEVEGIKGDWPDRDPETNTGIVLNDWLAGYAPANVWLGTSVENQESADERIPALLKIPAQVRFLSCEPLLGPVDIGVGFRYFGDGNHVVQLCCGVPTCECNSFKKAVHWVICGGESGPNARPMHPDWARSLRDQCKAADVPFLFKQWGEWAPGHNSALPMHITKPGEIICRFGKKATGRTLDGQLHTEFPKP